MRPRIETPFQTQEGALSGAAADAHVAISTLLETEILPFLGRGDDSDGNRDKPGQTTRQKFLVWHTRLSEVKQSRPRFTQREARDLHAQPFVRFHKPLCPPDDSLL